MNAKTRDSKSSDESFEAIIDPIVDVANRWKVTFDEAEGFLEDVGYFPVTDGGVETAGYIESALERAEAHARTDTVEFRGSVEDMDVLSEVIRLGTEAYNESGYEPVDEDRFWGFREALIDRMHELDGNEFYDDDNSAEVWR